LVNAAGSIRRTRPSERARAAPALFPSTGARMRCCAARVAAFRRPNLCRGRPLRVGCGSCRFRSPCLKPAVRGGPPSSRRAYARVRPGLATRGGTLCALPTFMRESGLCTNEQHVGLE
jgi:hypothetical protein